MKHFLLKSGLFFIALGILFHMFIAVDTHYSLETTPKGNPVSGTMVYELKGDSHTVLLTVWHLHFSDAYWENEEMYRKYAHESR
jgi:hypothetical protein